MIYCIYGFYQSCQTMNRSYGFHHNCQMMYYTNGFYQSCQTMNRSHGFHHNYQMMYYIWGGNIQNVLRPFFFSNVTSNRFCFSFAICIWINISIQSNEGKNFIWLNIDVYSYANGKGETESVTSHVWKKKWTKHVLNVTSSILFSHLRFYTACLSVPKCRIRLSSAISFNMFLLLIKYVKLLSENKLIICVVLSILILH